MRNVAPTTEGGGWLAPIARPGRAKRSDQHRQDEQGHSSHRRDRPAEPDADEADGDNEKGCAGIHVGRSRESSLYCIGVPLDDVGTR